MWVGLVFAFFYIFCVRGCKAGYSGYANVDYSFFLFWRYFVVFVRLFGESLEVFRVGGSCDFERRIFLGIGWMFLGFGFLFLVLVWDF